MKKSGILVSLLIGTMALGGCGKSSKGTASGAATTPPVVTKIETTVQANHSVKAINLRSADGFALLAHAAISSIPASSITGKVGLRPGVRAMIGLTPEEVVGGIPEIFAGDDKDAAQTFITNAKIDLINAYNEAETKVADTDKVDLFGGALGNKILPAGVYKWNSRVTIPNDLVLEGTDSDVWVFKVAGDLRIGSDVTIKLSGGAQAKNVYWQVGDNVLVKAKSAMVGTVMAQLTVEMKEQASLNGRLFSKNDKIVLDKNTITKP
ncbi:MAG: ice-binding family protein [Bacteriovorax sp.]